MGPCKKMLNVNYEKVTAFWTPVLKTPYGEKNIIWLDSEMHLGVSLLSFIGSIRSIETVVGKSTQTQI